MERAPGAPLRALGDLGHITRLGRGVDANGLLRDDAIERAMRALEAVVTRARALGVPDDRIHAVGTSAVRDARNRDVLIERAQRELGVRLEVVDGAREAALTFRGALPGSVVDSGGVVDSSEAADAGEAITVVDVGGGSTELASGSGGVLERSVSLDVGSVRLFERHLADDPPRPAQVEALLADVDRAIDQARPRFERALVALAGTACTVAAVARGVHPFDAAAVHGTAISVPELREVARRLASMTIAERRAAPGVPSGREDVVAAGALVLLRIAERSAAQELRISNGGVRWGLALENLAPGAGGC